jgi:hypothetical protein
MAAIVLLQTAAVVHQIGYCPIHQPMTLPLPAQSHHTGTLASLPHRCWDLQATHQTLIREKKETKSYLGIRRRKSPRNVQEEEDGGAIRFGHHRRPTASYPLPPASPLLPHTIALSCLGTAEPTRTWSYAQISVGGRTRRPSLRRQPRRGDEGNHCQGWRAPPSTTLSSRRLPPRRPAAVVARHASPAAASSRVQPSPSLERCSRGLGKEERTRWGLNEEQRRDVMGRSRSGIGGGGRRRTIGDGWGER